MDATPPRFQRWCASIKQSCCRGGPRLLPTKALAILPAVLVLAACSVSGQGSIEGVITDQTGAPMPGASIEATRSGTGSRAESDQVGRYRLANLHAGVYSVTVSLPGFRSVRRDRVVLVGAFGATVNATL